jgi:hypothetical protein
VGAIVAIPLAAIIQLLLNHFVIDTAVPDESSIPGRDQASVLRYEVQELTRDIRRSIREKEDTPDDEADEVEDTIEAIASDLDSALAARQNKAKENNGVRKRIGLGGLKIGRRNGNGRKITRRKEDND